MFLQNTLFVPLLGALQIGSNGLNGTETGPKVGQI